MKLLHTKLTLSNDEVFEITHALYEKLISFAKTCSDKETFLMCIEGTHDLDISTIYQLFKHFNHLNCCSSENSFDDLNKILNHQLKQLWKGNKS